MGLLKLKWHNINQQPQFSLIHFVQRFIEMQPSAEHKETPMSFGRNYYYPPVSVPIPTVTKVKQDEFIHLIIDGQFKITKKIDEGAFGKIYLAISIRTGIQVAIKFQSINAEHPQLISQCKLYEKLHNNPKACDIGFPRVLTCGFQGTNNYLVMDLMGESLESLLSKSPQKKFSLKTVLMLADQMITLVQYFHDRNMIHRDIKPDNFCMGKGQKQHKLHLIDFGLAKPYIGKNGKHIPYREGKSLTGTARYASVHTHNGIEQSRRDDMESIGYVILYLLKGSLVWQGCKSHNKFDKYQKIKQMKSGLSLDKICAGVPLEFKLYIATVRDMKFQAKPDYDQLRQPFRDLFKKCSFDWNYQYDWTQSPPSNCLNKLLDNQEAWISTNSTNKIRPQNGIKNAQKQVNGTNRIQKQSYLPQ